jgi:hypothetical protein
MDMNGDGLKEIVLEDNPDVLEGVSGLTIWLLIPFRKANLLNFEIIISAKMA